MAVRLLFLGRLQDAAGGEAREVRESPGDTVGALIDRLEPALAAALRSPRVRVAVNGTLAGLEQPLASDDEVAFLPPVSGG